MKNIILIIFISVNFFGSSQNFRVPKSPSLLEITEEKPLIGKFKCSSFYPLISKEYIVSAWVKESSINVPTYSTKSFLQIEFLAGNGAQQLSVYKFYVSGNIIDGWQRIVGKFKAPNIEDSQMRIELVNDNQSIDAYFDDIRIFPYNGSIKSFVYDETNQRLMAELDENNYSTFYEYDLEGGLVRVKKETEKGVYTIQETRSGNTKTESNGN